MTQSNLSYQLHLSQRSTMPPTAEDKQCLAVTLPKNKLSLGNGQFSDSTLVSQTSATDFPVSMMVHGGTGIHHGNSTNLTINQYVCETCGQDTARELLAGAIKATIDSSNLFNPRKDEESQTSSNLSDSMAKFQKKGYCVVFVTVVVLSLIPLVTIAAYSHVSLVPGLMASMRPVFGNSTDTPSTESSNATGGPFSNSKALQIWPRVDWLAEASTETSKLNSLPVSRIIIGQTSGDECSSHSLCILILRQLQKLHIETDHCSDIRYNFMITSNGDVYQGRGWDQEGEHTVNYNNNSLGIVFVGTYESKVPNSEQLESFRQLVELGVEQKRVSTNYSLVAHCQLLSEGYEEFALVQNVASWPNFDNSLPLARCTREPLVNNIAAKNP